MSTHTKHGSRHGYAFVLMQIAKKPGYGLDILNRLNSEMPHEIFDTAAVYRALKHLEKQGAIKSEWDTSEKGAAKKNYFITPEGVGLLNDFGKRIKMKLSILSYLDNELEKLVKDVD